LNPALRRLIASLPGGEPASDEEWFLYRNSHSSIDLLSSFQRPIRGGAFTWRVTRLGDRFLFVFFSKTVSSRELLVLPGFVSVNRFEFFFFRPVRPALDPLRNSNLTDFQPPERSNFLTGIPGQVAAFSSVFLGDRVVVGCAYRGWLRFCQRCWFFFPLSPPVPIQPVDSTAFFFAE